MKVIGHPMSPGTRLVLMALAEKKARCELVALDFMKGEHKQPPHLARQPFGKFPVLEHDGLTLFESRAILRYIDEVLPGTSLVPGDAKQRALVDQWVNVELGEFFATGHMLALEVALKPMLGMPVADPATIENLRVGTGKVLAVLDKALAGQRYLAGDAFSIADMVYLPDLETLHGAGEAARLAKFENVSRWWQETAARPSWIAAKSGKTAL